MHSTFGATRRRAALSALTLRILVAGVLALGLFGMGATSRGILAQPPGPIYSCAPGTIFGVGPEGIFEIRPYARSLHLIKGMSGATSIAGGLDGNDLFVTVGGTLMHLHLNTLYLDTTGLNVPASTNSLSEGLDGFLYLGTSINAELYQIDLGITPPTIVSKGGMGNLYSGDLAMDPEFRTNWVATNPLLWMRAAVGAPPAELDMVRKTDGIQQHLDSFWTPGLLYDPMEGLAYTKDGQLWGSDSRVGVPGSPPDRLWYFNDHDTGNLTHQMDLEHRIVDLASEPDYCSYDRPNVPHPDDLSDAGDAPDSSNHASQPMLAYNGVEAHFPTVWDPTRGFPYGPRHRSLTDAVLGGGANPELDADLLSVNDPDPVPNIDPWAGVANQDGGDDGFATAIVLPHCQLTSVSFTTTVQGAEKARYVTIWFDFNRDGDWQDTVGCTDPSTGSQYLVPERAVFNMEFTLGPGTALVSTPSFRAADPMPGADLWMRATLTDHEIVSTDGRGIQYGYAVGETEDYLLTYAGEDQYQP